MSTVLVHRNGELVEVPHDSVFPPVSLADAKLAVQAKIRARRKVAEEAGTVVNDMTILTDAVSQGKITGAVNLFANDPTLETIDWEATPGNWVTVDSATMMTIGIAAGRHVQGCFSRARVLSAA